MTSIFEIHPIWRDILAHLGRAFVGHEPMNWSGVATMPAWGPEGASVAQQAVLAAAHAGQEWAYWSTWGVDFDSQDEWEAANDADRSVDIFPPREGTPLIFHVEGHQRFVIVLTGGRFVELALANESQEQFPTLVGACELEIAWNGDTLVAESSWVLLTSEEAWAVKSGSFRTNGDTPVILGSLVGMHLAEQDRLFSEALARTCAHGEVVGHYANLPPETYSRQVGALGWAVQPANRALGPFFSSLPEEIREPLGYRTPEGIAALWEFVKFSNNLASFGEFGKFDDIMPTFSALVSGFVSDVRGFA